MADTPDSIQRERLREIALAERIADIQVDFEVVTCNKQRLLLASEMVRAQAELAECRRIISFQQSVPVQAK
jgi:uncharacterized protein (DUF111 family)